MASEVNVMSKEQLYMYLEREGLDSDVIETLRSNKISGSSFLELASEHLKELFPVIGDRIAVHKFLEKIKGPSKMDSIASSSKSMGTHTVLSGGSWLRNFVVPSEFSHKTKEAIKTGVLPKAARCEITAALATRVLQATRYPTPNEYQTVCIKLIQKYPTLEDPVGNGYGTWRKQLRTKFKNSRRGENESKKENTDPQDDNEQPRSGGGELESTSPAAKRRKSDNSLEEECEYEHSKDLIHLEWDKKKPKLSTLKELMDATFERRREWITLSCPSADDVLETYPCLAHGKILRHELRKMQDLKTSTDDLTKDWPLWVKRVFAFSKLEAKSRGSLRDLLSQAETTKEGISKDDHDGVYFLYLLSSLLAGKRTSNTKLLYQFQDSVNLDSEIAKIDKGTPYLIMLTSEEGQQFFVVVERALIAESGNVTTAVLNLIASYFVFDIVYPQPLYAVLIFIQHIVLGIVDKQKPPNSVTILLSSLTKITV